MRLKIATTSCLIFGALLLLAWPWVVGIRPGKGAPRAELAAYASRFMWYVTATVLTFVVTAFLAILVMRRAREQYREASMRNLETLLEGVREDHAGKQQS